MGRPSNKLKACCQDVQKYVLQWAGYLVYPASSHMLVSKHFLIKHITNPGYDFKKFLLNGNKNPG